MLDSSRGYYGSELIKKTGKLLIVQKYSIRTMLSKEHVQLG